MDNRINRSPKVDWTLIGLLLFSVLGYIFIHDLLGTSLIEASPYNSYTLQAMAWREGRMHLGQDYPWLELAIHNGNYYVSFPPIPSVVIFPLTFIFGYDVPTNLVIMVYALVALLLAYRLAVRFGLSRPSCAFFAAFVVYGSNMLWMSTQGAVWFEAQLLNMVFCLGAAVAAASDKRYAAMALLALAVGCRPFSIVFFPFLMAVFYLRDRQARPKARKVRLLTSQWRYLALPAVIGVCYMAYNIARFGNPLEFGHNYLPEFTNAEHGQFSLTYVLPNLYNIFVRPITLDGQLHLSYPVFDGFMFYVANPLFIVFAAYIVKAVFSRSISLADVVLFAAMALNIFFLCLHKTMGGWQFGARYLADLLPFAYLFILEKRGGGRIKPFELVIGVFAFMLNLYGALAMTIHHS